MICNLGEAATADLAERAKVLKNRALRLDPISPLFLAIQWKPQKPGLDVQQARPQRSILKIPSSGHLINVGPLSSSGGRDFPSDRI